MNRGHLVIVLGMVLLLLLSCSTKKSNVVTPAAGPSGDLSAAVDQVPGNLNKHLMGVYEVIIDPGSMTADVVPLRGVDVTLNVTPFFDIPPMNINITIPSFNDTPSYLDVYVDFELTHPLSGLTQYTLFDVMLVFLGDGSDTFPGANQLKIAGDNNQQVFNEDGYTRWFNAMEFKAPGVPILAYDPTILGIPGYTPTAELNPYKYFTTGLSLVGSAFNYVANHPQTRGYFSVTSENHRIMEIRFPKSKPLVFQLMVIANWEEPYGSGEPYSLGTFPNAANSQEALLIDVKDNSNLFYTGNAYGGSVILDISPLDWSADTTGEMDEYLIRVYSDAWIGANDVDMTPVDSGNNYYTFRTDIPVETLTSTDPLDIWIRVIYQSHDYKNDFGVSNSANGYLTSFFKTEVPVSNNASGALTVISPNGGEKFIVGEDYNILWESFIYSTGTVTLEYSKNNFTTPILIESGVPNTGSWLWQNIPDNPTTNAKVRVKYDPAPAIRDKSDNVFSIEQPYMTLVSPNGGEVWFFDSSHDIKWDTNLTGGSVTLEYSKDGFATPIMIVAGTANDGVYLWDPIPGDPSSTVRVRVTYDQDNSFNDMSDADFTIMDSAFDITSPAGGELWFSTFDYEITWTTTMPPGDNVRLEYYLDDDPDTMYPIIASTLNDGSHWWFNLPQVDASNVRVRVTYLPDEFFYGESPGVFTIALPEINIISPNGGESLPIGGNHTIQWSTAINAGTVDIHYSKDDFGADVNTIVLGHDINTDYLWQNIPDDLTDTAKVKVVYVPNPAIEDVSDGYFSICYGTPQNITGFSATDGSPALGQRKVKLTWDPVPCHTDSSLEIKIQRRNYVWNPPFQDPGTWSWQNVATRPITATQWTDNNARHSGTSNTINYRARLDNGSGSYSPSWATDTGYPKLRNIGLAMWCWSSNGNSSGALYPWTRGQNNANWCNDFWNDYGVNFVLENSGDWFYFTNPNWKIITGNESDAMHVALGQTSYSDSINVYYFEWYTGSGPQGAWCRFPCNPAYHDTTNVYIGIWGPAYSPAIQSILAHENGHAVGRFFDEYLVDANGNLIIESWESCSSAFSVDFCYLNGWSQDNWYLFCDEDACYPENPNAWSKTPKNLMWYSWQTVVGQYDIIDSQYNWLDAWLSTFSSNYPIP